MISVFGSSGFIGSKFCEMFPDEIIRIERNHRKPQSNDVLYLISTTHNYHVFEDPLLDIETNLSTLIKTLETCKDLDLTFNFVSSWFIYGDTELPATEDNECQPRGFYSITKKAAEDLLISYCSTFGIRYRILRLANVIGPGDDFSKKKNALQFLAEKICLDQPIDLYYGGDFIRDYIHVSDVCRAIHLCIKKAPLDEIINIGSGVPYQFRDLIEQMIQITESESKITPIVPPEFHKIVQVKNMYLNVDKLKALGFDPEESMTRALSEIIQYSKDLQYR